MHYADVNVIPLNTEKCMSQRIGNLLFVDSFQFMATLLDELCKGMRKILYGDDILLIAPSVGELQRLFINCERELEWLDMRINVKKITLLSHWSSI